MGSLCTSAPTSSIKITHHPEPSSLSDRKPQNLSSQSSQNRSTQTTCCPQLLHHRQAHRPRLWEKTSPTWVMHLPNQATFSSWQAAERRSQPELLQLCTQGQAPPRQAHSLCLNYVSIKGHILKVRQLKTRELRTNSS